MHGAADCRNEATKALAIPAGLETRWRHREALGMPRMRITLQAPPAPRHFLQQVSVQDGIWPEQAQWDADPSSID